MHEFGLIIVSNVVTVPVAYFVGHRLRRIVPQKRRFPIAFSTVLITLTIAFILSLEFQTIRLIQFVATAIAIGFPLGIVVPPFNDQKGKNVQGKK